MSIPVWEWFVAAAFAPAAVWVLWRVQVVSVEALRIRLVKLVRHAEWLYTMVSWFGTLLHEMSHAIVLLLGGHGIESMRVRSETGHVTPRRIREGGIGFISFLAAAMAPMFLPPALVLGAMLWWVDPGIVAWAHGGAGLDAALDVLQGLAVDLPVALLRGLAGLDVTDPAHIVVLFLVLLSAPGSRPSHVKGSRFHGRDDEGDVAVIRRRIRRHPAIFIAFLAGLYGLYLALVPWLPQAYWWPVQAVWAVAFTGIVLALFGAAWWTIAYWNSRIAPWMAWFPVAVLVAAEALPRILDLGWSLQVINGLAIAAWLLTSLIGRLAVPR